MDKRDEYHKRRFRQILQEKGIYADVVIDDLDVSCDVRRQDNCKLLLDKYESDCEKSKASQKNMRIKEPIGLPERLKIAKKNAEICKDGRLDYIKNCCRSKTNERALATDMGHLVQIVKMQKLEDFIDGELIRKAEERKQKEAERKIKEAEERKLIEAERKKEAEERRKRENEERRKRENERKVREAEERKIREAERKVREAEKQREAEKRRIKEAEKEEAKKEITEKETHKGSRMPPEIENKITRFLISEKYKISDVTQVLKLCMSVYERVLKMSTDLNLLREVDIALTVVKVQLTDLIGPDHSDTVLNFLIKFLLKKIRERR